MHAAGIEFHHAFFIGQPPEADGVVVRIVLRPFDHLNGGVEGICAAF